jgi:hypothetical protein
VHGDSDISLLGIELGDEREGAPDAPGWPVEGRPTGPSEGAATESLDDRVDGSLAPPHGV